MKLKIYGKRSVFEKVSKLKTNFLYFNGITKYDKTIENYVYKYLSITKQELECLLHELHFHNVEFLYSCGGDLAYNEHSFKEPYPIRIRFMEYTSEEFVKECISNVYGSYFGV